MKPFVYIASPYTKGDPGINVNFQLRLFDTLLTDGIVVPFAPLWSHFQHTAFPRKYDDWVKWDNEIIQKMDACLRQNSFEERTDYVQFDSNGADAEEARFRAQGKPVFYDIKTLYEWVNSL